MGGENRRGDAHTCLVHYPIGCLEREGWCSSSCSPALLLIVLVAAAPLLSPQSYLNKVRQQATVDAYLFAPPNAGDADFVSAFNKLVNARRLPFQYDVVPQVSQRPCTAFAAGLCVGCGLLRFKSILCSCVFPPVCAPP